MTQPLDPSKPVVLTMYNPFPLPGTPLPQQCTLARLQLFNMTCAQIESAVREQFTKLFGDYGFNAKRGNRRHHYQPLGARHRLRNLPEQQQKLKMDIRRY